MNKDDLIFIPALVNSTYLLYVKKHYQILKLN